jgi:P27 family predicted phage terminase small subunit
MLYSMKGRPPKPKHLLQLHGSKRANNREELGTPPAEPMQPPEWLKPRAQEVFRNLVEWLTKMGTLAETDEHVITRYCVTYVAWEHAAKAIQAIDALYVEVLDASGSIRFSRPTAMAMQAKETGEQLRHLETVLGLTPADRTRLGYGAVKLTTDPVDALFDNTAAG